VVLGCAFNALRRSQRKKIGADGSIVAVEYEEAQKDRGFRPGMPRLRDMKKAWTLTDFLEMDEKVCESCCVALEFGGCR
jgi:hypothetical protein